jgi:hypothetical protein
MLRRLEDICPGRPDAIRAEDWKALKELPPRAAPSAVERLFYPGAPAETLLAITHDEARGHPYRSARLLTKLSPAEYHAAYTYIRRTTTAGDAAPWPDPEALLNRGPKEGHVLAQVMSQIAQWINPAPATFDPRESNKPPHWRDFTAGLTATHPDEAELIAQRLQRDVFGMVQGRWDELEGILEGDVGQPAYVARFDSLIWYDLLVLVHQTVGPRFVGDLARWNQGLPPRPSSEPKPALIRGIGEAIHHHPRVIRNPALRTPAALAQLMERIGPLIAAWAVDMCDQGLRAQVEQRTSRWPPSIVKEVQEERRALGQAVQDTSTTPEGSASVEGAGSPERAARVVTTPIEISPKPVVRVSSRPEPPARRPMAKSRPLSDVISSLTNIETPNAGRKTVGERPGLVKPSQSQRPSPGKPGRNHRPEITPKPQRPSWASEPAARPY